MAKINVVRKSKILLIDDDEITREVIEDLLQTAGYNIEFASNGKEGFEKISVFQPDVIVCDYLMPEMNGLQLLEKIRREKVLVSFVFLTAHADVVSLRKGMNHGADDYLIKPFEPKDLLDCVASRLERSALIREYLESEKSKITRKMLMGIPNEFGNLLNGMALSFHCLKDASNASEADEAYNDGIHTIARFYAVLKTYFRTLEE